MPFENQVSASKSRQMPPSILGLIGSASSNLATRIGALGVLNQKTKALISIATALPYLDYMKSTEGKASLYSLPASVVSSCDNAKTYHFWMAAYLARMLANKNEIGPDGIAAAVFVAEKGYQVSRNITNDRAGSASSIITKMPYDPVHQVQRMDLNFAAAGAEFGARSLTTDTKLNLDQSLVSMIENSRVTPPVSKEEAKGMGLISTYLKWEKEVSPNTALDAVEKQLP